MKNNSFIALLLVLMIVSCNNNRVEKSILLDRVNKLYDGEYPSEINQKDGISVRGDKLAFYKDGQFTSDDIFKFIIFDSIHESNNKKKIIGKFLKLYDSRDTTFFEISKISKNSLHIMVDGEIKNFNKK